MKSEKVQEFSEYMCDFLETKGAGRVVEIGSDVQLRVASRLAPSCEKYCSVSLSEDTERMRGWHEVWHEDIGIDNIELVAGNATRLSELIPKADVIVLHNVLLDLTGQDTALMWKHKRGEVKLSAQEWGSLVSRFDEAKELGYRECLKVANPGHIVTFRRSDPRGGFRKFLVERLGIEPRRIETRSLFYDGSEDLWELHIIDNT